MVYNVTFLFVMNIFIIENIMNFFKSVTWWHTPKVHRGELGVMFNFSIMEFE